MKPKVILSLFVISVFAACNGNKSTRILHKDAIGNITETVVEEAEEVPETKEYGVDLGLSVNWAECNVGADSPEEVGCCIPLGNVTGTTKAPTNPNPAVSGTSSDIAVVKLGEGWRMPTGLEMKELKEKCSWTVETLNGQNGFRVTGPNGNSIFLPNSGSNYSTESIAEMNIKHDTSTNIDYEGNYWCGTPTPGNFGLNHLAFRTDLHEVNLMWCELYYCNAVRPVHE